MLEVRAEKTIQTLGNTTVPKRVKCDRNGCNKSFRSYWVLNRHLKAHDRGTVQKTQEELASKRIFECGIAGCSQGFTRRWKLKCHQEAKHSKVIIEKKSSPDKSSKDVAEFGETVRLPERVQTQELTRFQERPFKCYIGDCGKSYINECHLQRHKDQSHSLEFHNPEQVVCKIENCGKIFVNKYTLKSHMEAFHIDATPAHDSLEEGWQRKRSDIEKVHKCDEPGCNAAFTRPYRLKNHKLSAHRGEKPFKCFYKGCDKCYTNESHLARHVYITHASKTDISKQVICGMEGCGMMLADKSALKKHIARNHREFPFSCSDCNEKFKRKTQLHAHKVEIHEAEAPYKCQSCPRTFIHYHLYKKHSANHRAYHCDCEKTFVRWSKLLEHKRTECTAQCREYKCVICDKVFPVKKALTDHSISVHLPDSQSDLATCPYLNCTRAYKRRRNLNQHIKLFHAKIVVNMTCPKEGCEVVFKSNKNLKQHLRIVHSGLPPKVRKPRKPRKDRGSAKKSMASTLSGAVVSIKENKRNIVGSSNSNDSEKKTVADNDLKPRAVCCNRDSDASKKDNSSNNGNGFDINKTLKMAASGTDRPVCSKGDIGVSNKGLQNIMRKLKVIISSADRAAGLKKVNEIKENENLIQNMSTAESLVIV